MAAALLAARGLSAPDDDDDDAAAMGALRLRRRTPRGSRRLDPPLGQVVGGREAMSAQQFMGAFESWVSREERIKREEEWMQERANNGLVATLSYVYAKTT